MPAAGSRSRAGPAGPGGCWPYGLFGSPKLIWGVPPLEVRGRRGTRGGTSCTVRSAPRHCPRHCVRSSSSSGPTLVQLAYGRSRVVQVQCNRCTTGERLDWNRGRFIREDGGMTAQILDGKATAAAIKSDLTARVAALKEKGVTPGLGTLLVGDDPGSRWYVNGKHRDCAAGRHRLHPARTARDRHPGGDRGGRPRTQRRPGVHRLHRPAPAPQGHRRPTASWS